MIIGSSKSKIKAVALSLSFALSSNAVKAQSLQVELKVICIEDMPKARVHLSGKKDANKSFFRKYDKFIKSLGTTTFAYAIFILLTNPFKSAQETCLKENKIVDIAYKRKTAEQINYIENISWLRKVNRADKYRISSYVVEDTSMAYLFKLVLKLSNTGLNLPDKLRVISARLKKNIENSQYSLISIQEQIISLIEEKEKFQEKEEALALLSQTDQSLKINKVAVILEMSEDYYYCLRERVQICLDKIPTLEDSDHDKKLKNWSYDMTLTKRILQFFEQKESHPCYESGFMLQNFATAQEGLKLYFNLGMSKWFEDDEIKTLLKKVYEDSKKDLLEYNDI